MRKPKSGKLFQAGRQQREGDETLDLKIESFNRKDSKISALNENFRPSFESNITPYPFGISPLEIFDTGKHLAEEIR